MSYVQLGDTVRIHYTSTLEDGMLIASTEGGNPLELQPGQGMFFQKLEQEILGMGLGEVKRTTLIPEEAFGLYRQELVTDIALEEFTNRGIKPYEGLTLDIPTQGDQTLEAKVTKITKQKVQLDANHPWAGHSMKFFIQVVDIV